MEKVSTPRLPGALKPIALGSPYTGEAIARDDFRRIYAAAEERSTHGL